MKYKQLLDVDSYLEKSILIIAIIITSIVPFIVYPKTVINNGQFFPEIFVYYKAITVDFIAIVSFFILSYRIVSCITTKAKIRLNVSLLLFTLWVGLSACFAYDIQMALYGSKYDRRGLFAYIGYFVFFTLISNFFNEKHLKYLVYVILGSSLLMSLLCLSEFYNFKIIEVLLSETLIKGYCFDTQVHSTIGNSNRVGSYFSLMLPLVTTMYLRGKNTRSVFLLLAILLNYAGIIVSLSRIAWIGAFISICICAVFIEKNRAFYAKLSILFAIMFITTLTLNLTGQSLVSNQISNILTQANVALSTEYLSLGSYRVFLYQKFILLTFSDVKNMFFGVGPDCLSYYGMASAADLERVPVLAGIIYSNAHSDFIQYMATMGIPALVLYSCFIVTIFLSWSKKYRIASPEKWGIFAAWTGYLIQSAFNVTSVGVIPTFFIFSAILYTSSTNR